MSDYRIDPTALLTRSLDALAMRQRVTADNVANVDTPGFKASEVRFENVLRRVIGEQEGAQLAMARTDGQHMLRGGALALDLAPQVVQQTGMSLRNDENNVDIEQQMAELAETTLRFNAVSESLSRRFAMQRTIASDGRM
jgi:flagellar basal-body rod protein FlgB